MPRATHTPSTGRLALPTAIVLALLPGAGAMASLVETTPLSAPVTFIDPSASGRLTITPTAGGQVLSTSVGSSGNALATLSGNLPPGITAQSVAPGLPSYALLSFGNGFELTLWNFITTIRAQQNGQTMLTARGNMATIEYVLGGAATTVVPLPAAGWLFLSGLAALALLRRRGAARA
jgi:hypothetical protein